MDIFSRSKRRQIMQSVRREHTRPEQLVARLLDEASIRFSQHLQGVPGKPDFVLPDHRIIVFVHGCFWHGHKRCRKGRNLPKTRSDYWQQKIDRNRERDRRIVRRLRRERFGVFTLWECELKSKELPARLMRRLRPEGRSRFHTE